MSTTDRSEVLLLVDDEPAILDLMARMLAENGYQTLEALSGSRALEVAEDQQDPIHLLVTDIVMPSMQGFELAAGLQEVHPETRVLFLSGHLEDRREVLEGLAHTPYPFLLKPFTAESLGKKVRAILEAAAAEDDRRRQPREEIHLPVRYRVEGETQWQLGTTIDISECGLLLDAPGPLETGQRIDLELTLPKGLGRHRPGRTRCCGFVTRHVDTTRAVTYPIGVFVAF
ncbi:MAG: response regulator [Dehalococcoidia bacterium]|nr:response regulator [Dehalococcoidia bacterium]